MNFSPQQIQSLKDDDFIYNLYIDLTEPEMIIVDFEQFIGSEIFTKKDPIYQDTYLVIYQTSKYTNTRIRVYIEHRKFRDKY